MAKAKEESYLLDVNKDIKLQKALINKNSYLTLGFSTKEEYVRTFYYLFRTKGFSLIDFLPTLKLTLGTLQSHLRKLEINFSHTEGMQGKATRGKQDYGKHAAMQKGLRGYP